LRPLPARAKSTVSVLDIGGSNIVCLIAELQPLPADEVTAVRTHGIRIIGIGHQAAAGLKAGVVVDPQLLRRAVCHAVSSAERMAHVELRSVIINVTGGRLASHESAGSLPIQHPVTYQDMADVCAVAGRYEDESRSVVHSLPFAYRLGAEEPVVNPIGLYGDKLSVRLHRVSADATVLRNLIHVVELSRLSVAGVVASPYAAGLSVLSDEEMEMGSVLLDIGGGTTSIAVFEQGHLIHADAVAIGGTHITMDIARGLTLRVSQAERLKIAHATVLPNERAVRDVVALPPAYESKERNAGIRHIPKGHLARIVQPRVEEILEFVRDRIRDAGYEQHMKQRIVVTGGTAMLAGVDELAGLVMGGEARIGIPHGVRGMPSAARTPAFATAAGLLVYPQVAAREFIEDASSVARRYAATGTDTYFSKLGRWFKESF
jgi:cell division protein FtsA